LAIKYLDAKRIRGSGTAPSTPTVAKTIFQGAGLESKWVDNSEDISYNATTDVIDFEVSGSGNVDSYATFDLQDSTALNGSSASDTAWVLRFKLDITTYTLGHASSSALVIGISNQGTTNGSASQNGIGLEVGIGVGNDTLYRLQTANGGVWARGSAEATFTETPAVETTYVEVKRTSATNVTVSLYSDSAYSTLLEAETITNVSGTTGLRYLSVKSDTQAEASKLIGTISEFELWNSLTTATQDEKATLITAGTPASTGWTLPSGWTLTSGTGITVSTSSNDWAVYDIGASAAMDPNDIWMTDFDLTRLGGDVHDHPMLMIKSTNTGYSPGVSNNGDNQILVCYWANGNTGDSNGKIATGSMFRASNTNYENNTTTGTNVYIHAGGDTLYYRLYMTKSGDATRATRLTAWDSDANRTAEGSTGREFDNLAYNGSINSGWDSSNALRYFLVGNRNGNSAQYRISSWKFWNGSGAQTRPLGTPDVEFTFTDVPASSDLPENTIFEQTNDYKYYFLQSGAWVAET